MFKLAAADVADTDSYDRAVLSEVQMVLEFIAGKSNLTVKDMEIADPDSPDRKLNFSQIAAKLEELEDTLDDNKTLSAAEKTLLLCVRDAANTIVRPASGVTIAYTALVLQSSRGRFDKARVALAHRAFPGLVPAANSHRRWQRALVSVALILTLGAVWESTKLALGQSLLRSRAELRIQQQAISTEKLRLEAALTSGGSPLFDKLETGKGGKFFVRLCDRPGVLRSAMRPERTATAVVTSAMLMDATTDATTDIFESPEQQDVCDRDTVLALHFASSTQSMAQYETDWPRMVGAGFPQVEAVVGWLARRIGWNAAPVPATGANDHTGNADLEFLIAPALLATGNYVLPVIFAVLGASAYAVLDFYGKANANLLVPGDRILSWIRLMLGVIIGACVGLFFSSGQPSDPAQGQGQMGALTLSASGLAFIGGYGVEGVFSMLNMLVGRVFDAKGTPTVAASRG